MIQRDVDFFRFELERTKNKNLELENLLSEKEYLNQTVI